MITITRDPLRSLPGLPKRARFIYSYQLDEAPAVEYGTSVVELRRMLKRRFAGHQIQEGF